MKRNTYIALLFFLAGILSPVNSLFAQFYNGSQLTFGKNRVQYNDFLWSYFRFENYDTYFYLNGKELALFTAQYAQEQIAAIEKNLETSLDEKIKFIIFNTLSDLKQSNLGMENDDEYNTGGETRILDDKVILYFDGNHEHLKNQIRTGITKILLNQLLYGTSLTSQVKNSTLLFLPDWYLNGLILYLTEEWNTETENMVKDGILNGRYKRFNGLTGKDAAYAGQSLWQFIAEKYSPERVSEIVYMAKISKNVESGFLYVLGVSFKSIINEWAEYYKNKYNQFPQQNLPDNINKLKLPSKNLVYDNLKISPDGRFAAFSSNNAGLYKIFIYDLQKKKRKLIFKRGFRLDDEADHSYPLIAWQPSGKLLSFITEEKGKTKLYFYTLSNKNLDHRFIFSFDKILDYAYSPDGKLFVVSAVIKGQSDIFLYNIAANSYEQITKDVYDDLQPGFIDNGNRIVFSSNRDNDSLRPVIPADFYSPQGDNYDLFVYDIGGNKRNLRQITKTPFADEWQPMEYDKGYFSYLSDDNGIRNRYIAHFDSAISFVDTTTHYRYFTESFPVTDYCRNIEQQDISVKAGKYGEIIFSDNSYKLFIADLPKANEVNALKLRNTYFMINSLEKASKVANNQPASAGQETKRRKHFVTVSQDEIDIKLSDDQNIETNKIDINNYVFDKQAFIKLTIKDTVSKETAPVVNSTKTRPGIPKQLNYLVEYSINELVTQLDFNYLNANYQTFSGGSMPIYLNPGLNAFIKLGVSDLLGNYNITGGVRLSFDMRNNEYLVNFANYKDRLDKSLTFHRQVIENASEYYPTSIRRVFTHECFYRWSWPFNNVLSLRGTATLRNDRTVYLATDDNNLRVPNAYKNWTGLKGELVFDATRNLGLNLYLGTRYKIFSEYWQQVSPDRKTLFVIGADFRNYQQISRTLIWANRFAASSSFGNNKLVYYMGGVDNWLAPRFNDQVPVATDNNYAYQTLATNMRGFEQNIRNGNSFAVLNSEIRFPVFRYFANRPIKSDFINNFQIATFGDLGTAWNGPSPYSRENSLYEKIYKQGSMTITVENQVEPLVGGYGFGIRTRFLGYFMRADWAWGVEDMVVGKGIFYFSLNLDF